MALRDHDFSSLNGALQFDAPLAPLSWFRVGGPADLLFTPENEEDLIAFLKALPLMCRSSLLVWDPIFSYVTVVFAVLSFV